MSHPAKAVANYFLKIATDKNESLSHLKLQKLVYIAHGLHLALTDKPLIKEDIEAWKYGPVVREIYNDFKSFGSDKITKYSTYFDEKNSTAFIYDIEQSDNISTKELALTKKILNAVWDTYGKNTGLTLSAISHRKGSPWDTVYNKKDKPWTKIDNDIIKKYFDQLIEKV